jgi:glycosyltransferase involved in cell wall biosynthesis
VRPPPWRTHLAPGGAALSDQPNRPAPLVSVVVPTRNRADYLGETIRSALDQGLAAVEVIVADNASADATPDVVAGIGDPRVSLARVETGLSMAENMTRCLSLGSAPYLMVLHDDDLVRPGGLERQVAVLDANPRVAFVYSTFEVIDEHGTVFRARTTWPGGPGPAIEPGAAHVARLMAGPNRVHMSAALVRRSCTTGEAVEAGDQGYVDLGLFLRLSLRGDVAYLDEPLSAVRIHRGSASAADLGYYSVEETEPDDRTIEQFRDMHHVKRRFVREHPDLPNRDALLEQARRYMTRELVWLVDHKTRPGRPRRLTYRLLREAAAVEPRVLRTRGAARLALLALAGPAAQRGVRSRSA